MAGPLNLDDSLRRSAQKYADSLASERVTNMHNAHSSSSNLEFRFPNSGESLSLVHSFSGSIDNLCLEVAREWYNQVNDYDFVGIT